MPRPLRRALTAVHVAIFRATGGRALGSIDGLPVLLLTTVGRTSGKRRTMPLMYVEDDGALAVAASYSNDHNPGWYHNVVATPAVEVRSRAGVQTMRAALVDGRDRSASATASQPSRSSTPATSATPTASSPSFCCAPSSRTRGAPVALRPLERSPLLRARGRT